MHLVLYSLVTPSSSLPGQHPHFHYGMSCYVISSWSYLMKHYNQDSQCLCRLSSFYYTQGREFTPASSKQFPPSDTPNLPSPHYFTISYSSYLFLLPPSISLFLPPSLSLSLSLPPSLPLSPSPSLSPSFPLSPSLPLPPSLPHCTAKSGYPTAPRGPARVVFMLTPQTYLL